MTDSRPPQSYRARMRNVLHYIDLHLDRELRVEELSAVACLSKFHFHRQFAALFGLGTSRYVKLTRLKRASYELAFREERSVMDIALNSRYEGPEAFARAFKQLIGQTPSEFRDRSDWKSWRAAFEVLEQVRAAEMSAEHRSEQIRIVEFAETRVAVLEHRGDPGSIRESIRAFIEWRKQNGLHPSVSATFNVLYDDPAEVEANDFRLDLCATTDRDIEANPFNVVAKIIAGGRCAVLRHVGSDDTLGSSIRWLYASWLPESGQLPRDFPLYVQRVRFFPDVPEHEAVTDIFLPIV